MRSSSSENEPSLDVFAYPNILIGMQQAAQLFKALSEATRLRILSLLNRGELCVCEIEAALDLPQSTVSRHLALLRQADLVQGRRKGIWMHYRIAEPETDLHRALLSLVQENLTGLDTAARDMARLEKFQAVELCTK